MERRLTAVLMADVARYARLCSLDEEGTHDRLMSLRTEVIEPFTSQHGGRVVEYAGDGSLMEFPSLLRAAECAVAVQRSAAEREPKVPSDRRLSLRMGLHFGDVIAQGRQIMGHGVNIAARLEQLAEPGGICFSDRVHDEIAGKIDIDFEYGGEPPLKNIDRRVGVWFWPSNRRGGRAPRILPPPEKPSIGVLPFDTFGGSEEDEKLASGVVEDLTTALAHLNWLFVISRTSAFQLKGLRFSASEAGQRLGVRYLLEGSLRRLGSRVRVTSQLIDAESGAHLRADQFDGRADNLFEFLDEIVASTVGAIEPSLLRAENERIRNRRPESMGAYHHYLQATALMGEAFRNPTGGAIDEARELLARAVELAPDYAPALALAGYFEAKAILFGRHADTEAGERHALDLVERAVMADADEPLALGVYGFVSANSGGDLDKAAAYIDKAIKLNSNSPLLWNFGGEIRMYIGEHEQAIICFHRSMRLNPLDPRTITNEAYLAFAHFFCRQFDEAVRLAQRAVIIAPNPLSYRILAASLAEIGRIDEARTAASRLLEIQPNSCLGRSRESNYRRREDLDLYVEALRRSGLPEEPTGILSIKS